MPATTTQNRFRNVDISANSTEVGDIMRVLACVFDPDTYLAFTEDDKLGMLVVQGLDIVEFEKNHKWHHFDRPNLNFLRTAGAIKEWLEKLTPQQKRQLNHSTPMDGSGLTALTGFRAIMVDVAGRTALSFYPGWA